MKDIVLKQLIVEELEDSGSSYINQIRGFITTIENLLTTIENQHKMLVYVIKTEDVDIFTKFYTYQDIVNYIESKEDKND